MFILAPCNSRSWMILNLLSLTASCIGVSPSCVKSKTRPQGWPQSSSSMISLFPIVYFKPTAHKGCHLCSCHLPCLWYWCLHHSEWGVQRIHSVRFSQRRAAGYCSTGKDKEGRKNLWRNLEQWQPPEIRHDAWSHIGQHEPILVFKGSEPV